MPQPQLKCASAPIAPFSPGQTVGVRLSLAGGRRLAVDVGAAWTRVAVLGSKVRVAERSFVAVESAHVDASGPTVVAVGNAAHEMWGKEPSEITIVRPIHSGTLADFEIAYTLVRSLLRALRPTLAWLGAELVVPLPVPWSDVQRRGLRESLERAGARRVVFVASPIASAVGADLNPLAPRGRMLVNVGALSTTVSLLALGQVLQEVRLPVGGEHFDSVLRDQVAVSHRLVIGPRTAEALRHWAVRPEDPQARCELRGRDLLNGVPRRVEVQRQAILPVLNEPIRRIAAAVRQAIEQAPTELVSDIVAEGILLVGGGARLRGLDRAISALTQTAVVAAPSPEWAACEGAGRMLAQKKRYASCFL